MKESVADTLKKRTQKIYWIFALLNLVLGGLAIYLIFIIPRWVLVVLVYLSLVILLNFFLIDLFSNKITEPVHKMKDEIHSITYDQDYHWQNIEAEPLELQEIRNSINILLDRTDQRVDELQQFVANASHELRTPLTTIKLRVEALRDGAIQDPSVSGKFLQEIESEVDSLSKMVSDLLDLSHIESRMEEDATTQVDLSDITQEICAAFEMRAKQAEISIMRNIEDNLPKMIGTEDQLRRLLYNLIDNAIKYNHPGGQVTVSLKTEPDTKRLILTVADTGFGIPANLLPHVFERFYRAEATRPRYGFTRGSGLGLAIVKAIADRHKADIQVESEAGKGTRMILIFPPSPC